MLLSKCVKLKYHDPAAPRASAKVFDFDVRQSDSRRHHRLRALEQENALLTSVVAETRIEIMRLRKLLIGDADLGNGAASENSLVGSAGEKGSGS
jgi:hypothetical protein